MKVKITGGYLEVNYTLTNIRPSPFEIIIIEVYHCAENSGWAGVTNLVWLVPAINTAPEFESLRKVIHEAIEADFKKFQEDPESQVLGETSCPKM